MNQRMSEQHKKDFFMTRFIRKNGFSVPISPIFSRRKRNTANCNKREIATNENATKCNELQRNRRNVETLILIEAF
jgi:hypothetical protein